MSTSYLDQMEISDTPPPPKPKREGFGGAVNNPWAEVSEYLEQNPTNDDGDPVWGVFRDRAPSVASYLRKTWQLYVEVRDSTKEEVDGKTRERCTLWVRAATPDEKAKMKADAAKRAAQRRKREAERNTGAADRSAATDSPTGRDIVDYGDADMADDDGPNEVRDYMAESDADVEAQRRAAAAEASD